jgi:hypothetical protein
MEDSEEIVLSDRECVGCGRKIPQVRIDVLPNADKCVPCASGKKKFCKAEAASVLDLDLSQASDIDRTGFGPTD